jgi:hypothetical protein
MSCDNTAVLVSTIPCICLFLSHLYDIQVMPCNATHHTTCDFVDHTNYTHYFTHLLDMRHTIKDSLIQQKITNFPSSLVSCLFLHLLRPLKPGMEATISTTAVKIEQSL